MDFMLKLLLMIFLSWLCVEAAGQNVTIPKSTDIIVLRGKSYYMHTVQPGQTLFSICKAYGVAVEEIKELNNKSDNSLSLYEVLKVPFTTPFVQQDKEFYYHKVVKGETLYSIARDFNIKPKRLLKFNEEYADKPLSVGVVIKLPLNEIDQMALASREVKHAVLPEESRKQEKIAEGEEHPEGIHTEPVVTLGNKHRDTLPVQAWQEVSGNPKKEMPEYISEVVMPENPFVKVALLLPFSAREYPNYADTLGGKQWVDISPRSEQFVNFYEGILLAVDSLKNLGYKVELHIFDTERSGEKMYEIAGDINRLRPDLIIGPVYGSVYKAMAENLDNTDIPMVYPLSSRSESFGEYPNFIQVNASFKALAAKMVEWSRTHYKNANLIHIGVNSVDEPDLAEKKWFKEQLKQVGGVHFFNWDMAGVPLDLLRAQLLPDRENILFLPAAKEADVSKILPLLSALTDGYRITVVGLPEWQTFTSVDHETYYKLNTKIFTYSYVDYSTPAAHALAEKYRKFFYTEPGTLVFKAFDMGLYFIELAAKYRDRSLDALEYYDRSAGFSKFQFEKMYDGAGKENHGFYIVNFGSDYHLKIESPH